MQCGVAAEACVEDLLDPSPHQNGHTRRRDVKIDTVLREVSTDDARPPLLRPARHTPEPQRVYRDVVGSRGVQLRPKLLDEVGLDCEVLLQPVYT